MSATKRAWKRLPEPLRANRTLRRLLDPRLCPPPARTVRTLDELEHELQELDRRAAISDAELRAGFGTFRMEPSDVLPADPFSAEYRTAVLAMYARIAGKTYDTVNESTPVVLAEHAVRPFPYGTGNSAVVRDHLMRIAHVIDCVDPHPGQRILELGAGWGNTTLAIAQMHCSVTAVDVEPRFVELIAERARRNGADVTAVQGDFSSIDEMAERFDSVLFFESFHHAANHRSVLGSVARVLAPGGRVVFAGEPIYKHMPYPWGLRMDGESLWAIRRNGWMELGFTPAYFEELLRREGWEFEKRKSTLDPDPSYIARRAG